MPQIRQARSPIRLVSVVNLLAGLMALAAPLTLPSCRSPDQDPAPSASLPPTNAVTSVGDSQPDTFALALLRSQAEKEQSSPPARLADDIPTPPGLASDSLTLRLPDDPLAFLTQDDALTRLTASYQWPSAPELAAPDDQSLRQSVLAYIEARELFLEGKNFESIRRLEEAYRLNPASISILRLLARNYRASTGEATAVRYERDILALDPTDLEALFRVGSSALERNQLPEAVACLSRAALGAGPAPSALHARLISRLASLDLGKAFAISGCDSAAVRAWSSTLDPASPPPRVVGWEREYNEFLRDAVDVMARMGDAHVRLGDSASALKWYETAIESGNPDRTALLARLIHLDLRSGRPASAQWRLIDAMRQPSDPAGLMNLVEYLASQTDRGVFADAVAELAASDSQSSLLLQAALLLLPPVEGEELLARTFAQGDAEQSIDDIVAWAGRRGDPALALRLVIRAADEQSSPLRTARRLTDLTGDPDRLLNAWPMLDADLADDPFALSLRTLLLLRAGRPTDASAIILAAIVDHPDDPGLLLARIRLLLDQGLADDAQDLLAALTPAAAQNPALAYDIADLSAEFGDEPTARRLLALVESAVAGADVASTPLRNHVERKASVLIALGRFAAAVDVLQAGFNADPAHEQAALMLLDLTGPDGRSRDPQRYVEVGRSITRSLPQSRAARFARAEQDLVAGRASAAIPILRTLFEEDVTFDPALRALLSYWTRENRLLEAEEWIRPRLAQRPGDARLRSGLLEALLAQRKYADAIELTGRFAADRPDDLSAARDHARSLRASGRTEDARRVETAALLRLPASIYRTFALAELHLAAGDPSAAIAQLKADAARAPDAVPHQFEQLVSLALDAARDGAQAEAYAYIESIVDARRAHGGEISPAIAVHDLEAKVGLNRDFDAIRTALDAARSGDPDRDVALIMGLRSSLFAAGRTDDAMRLIDDELGENRPLVRADLPLALWRIDAASRNAQPDVAISLVARLGSASLLDSLPTLFLSASGGKTDAPNVLYSISGLFSNSGDQPSSERILAEVLRLDPDHPGANNDLGYNWVDRGQRLEEAATMILKAVRAQPDNDSFLDSIGWARYKQGRFTDRGQTLDERGAIYFLERASQLPEGRVNPVILDHLGDALWHAGQKADAVRAWNQVSPAYTLQLSRLGPDDSEDARAFRQFVEQYYSPVVKAAEAKVAAADAGVEPPVAHVIGSGW